MGAGLTATGSAWGVCLRRRGRYDLFRGLNNRRFNDPWAWRWNGALHLSAQQLGGGGLLPGFGHVDDRSSWLPKVEGIRNYRLWNRFRHRRWRGGSLHLVAQLLGGRLDHLGRHFLQPHLKQTGVHESGQSQKSEINKGCQT